jgi:DNA modification methylase
MNTLVKENTFYQDNSIKVYNKSSLDMSETPDDTIQCCVTSPPYWGLRKYAGEQDLIWDNHNGCEHDFTTTTTTISNNNGTGKSTLQGRGDKTQGVPDGKISTGQCSKCSAWRGSFGLEPTPELYIAHSMQFLKEIYRVLRKDGTVFWNLGDSYAGSCKGGNDYGGKGRADSSMYGEVVKSKRNCSRFGGGNLPASGYLKPKDLCLIPFRFALAAQEAGWWVRSVIIWSKNNPMPESVKDRPTESHEYIFLLTKSANYYWNQEAVRENFTDDRAGNPGAYKWSYANNLETGEGVRGKGGPSTKLQTEGWNADGAIAGRNLRSVWEFSTQPYREAHFATFPEALPKKCIMAGTKEGDTVLDPFGGSGTTAKVAKDLGRTAVIYEISTEYYDLILKRNRQLALTEQSNGQENNQPEPS